MFIDELSTRLQGAADSLDCVTCVNELVSTGGRSVFEVTGPEGKILQVRITEVEQWL